MLQAPQLAFSAPMLIGAGAETVAAAERGKEGSWIMNE